MIKSELPSSCLRILTSGSNLLQSKALLGIQLEYALAVSTFQHSVQTFA